MRKFLAIIVALFVLASLGNPQAVSSESLGEHAGLRTIDDIARPTTTTDQEAQSPTAALNEPSSAIGFRAIDFENVQQIEPVANAQTALSVGEARVEKPTPEQFAQYAMVIVDDLDIKWSDWFLRAGLNKPFATLNTIHPTTAELKSKCEIKGTPLVLTANRPNAYYCSADVNPENLEPGYIHLPAETMADVWTGRIFNRQVDTRLKRVGDFAAATIVAHEFGHHVQDEIAIQMKLPHPEGSNKELIADCFAGVWAYTAYLDGYLEAGDIDEALSALEVIGGDYGSSHGTGQERMNAFLIGYSGSRANPIGGEPTNCLLAFWPNAFGDG